MSELLESKGLSDRQLVERMGRFEVNEDGSFSGGSKVSYQAVVRELERRVARQAASEAAFAGPKIKREAESPTALHSAEIKSAQVEFFSVQGSASAGAISNNAGDSVFPPAPSTGTHVLGVINGIIQWIETEDC
jgi:hypothetical protein